MSLILVVVPISLQNVGIPDSDVYGPFNSFAELSAKALALDHKASAAMNGREGAVLWETTDGYAGRAWTIRKRKAITPNALYLALPLRQRAVRKDSATAKPRKATAVQKRTDAAGRVRSHTAAPRTGWQRGSARVASAPLRGGKA